MMSACSIDLFLGWWSEDFFSLSSPSPCVMAFLLISSWFFPFPRLSSYYRSSSCVASIVSSRIVSNYLWALPPCIPRAHRRSWYVSESTQHCSHP